MRSAFSALYLLVLSFWTGGAAMFTGVIAPAIFRSFERDQAGDIVGRLFPGYFLSMFAVSVCACILFLIIGDAKTGSYRLCLVLLTTAVLINAFVLFKLYPDAVQAKQQVRSFAQDPADAPARKRFARLHGVSTLLNIVVLADGVVLLVLSRGLGR